MSTTQTIVFQGKEEKAGTKRNGEPYQLFIFTGNDGKQYKTFEADIANAITLGQETTFQLDVGNPRPNPRGGMFAPDNFIRGLGAAPETASSNGSSQSSSQAGDLNRYLTAFGLGLKLVEMGAVEAESLDDFSTIAKAIVASFEDAEDVEPTPEDVPN